MRIKDHFVDFVVTHMKGDRPSFLQPHPILFGNRAGHEHALVYLGFPDGVVFLFPNWVNPLTCAIMIDCVLPASVIPANPSI